jgi:hypothetical protein
MLTALPHAPLGGYKFMDDSKFITQGEVILSAAHVEL